MLDALWYWIVFPWVNRGIFGVIAIAIGFLVFLWRFIDSKPQPFWIGVSAGTGFFVMTILWAPALVGIGYAFYWLYKESAYNRWLMSTDRQFRREGLPKPFTEIPLRDPSECTPSACRSCPSYRDCGRRQTLVTP